jgi:hypothetical protein
MPKTSHKSKSRDSTRLTDSPKLQLALLAVYLAFGIVGLLHHEMRRDEVYPLLLAKTRGFVRELFANVREDSPHGPIWHLILWVVTRFTHNPLAEQIVHLILAVSAVWLFLRSSPFNGEQKSAVLLRIMGNVPSPAVRGYGCTGSISCKSCCANDTFVKPAHRSQP